MDTLAILDGIGKNMRQQPILLSPMDCGSTLTHVHIMNIKVNTYGWAAFAKGLASSSCVLETLRINLVEFDRE